jgi:hypothetical protein
MPKVTPGINSLNGGEVSPLLDCRWDLNKYASSCKTMENALPLVEGGVKKMPGTYYVTAAAGTGKSRLAPFSFSTDQSYVLEFSDKSIRIFGDDGLLETQSGILEYDPATDYSIGDIVRRGVFWRMVWGNYPASMLYVCAKSGQSVEDLSGIGWIIDTSQTDTMTVEIVPTLPVESVMITWAQTTSSKNAANLIQAALRALGTINGVDCSEWTVTPNETYYNSPMIIPPPPGPGWFFPDTRDVWQAALNNQYFGFPNDEERYENVVRDWYPDDIVYPSGSTVSLVSPYLEEHLFELDLATQSADILFIFHHLYPAMELRRYSNTYWTLTEMEFLGTPEVIKPGYQTIMKNISDITQADPTTIKCVAHGLQKDDQIYISHIVGTSELNNGIFTVSAVTDSDNIQIDVNSASFGTYDSGGYLVKLSSLFSQNGEYPGCGTFFEQRLILAGFDNHPGRFCGSVSGDFYNFVMDPELEDYAVQFDLVSRKIDRIVWAVAQKKIAFGTASGVWIVSGNGVDPLSQTSIDTSMPINTGASHVAPQIINDTMIWMTRVSKVARLIQYDWQTDKWIAPDLTRIARHILLGPDAATSGIIQTGYQQDPYPIFWAIRNDGQLIGMTYESQEQVYAWFRIVTAGLFESVAVVPRENNEDRVWVVVNRS